MQDKSQEKAIRALEEYGAWLKNDLLPRSNGEFRLGAEKFNQKLSYTLNSEFTAEKILETKFKRISVPSWVEKHWDDLSVMAKQFDDMWISHLESGTVIKKGYIVDADASWFESFALRNNYLAKLLLTHLKAEFPAEFKYIDGWRDLLKEPLPKGCLEKLMVVVRRRTFNGTCDICQGWS